jgi:hypothetical protein
MLFLEENPQTRIPRPQRDVPILTKLPCAREEIVVVFVSALSKRGFRDEASRRQTPLARSKCKS